MVTATPHWQAQPRHGGLLTMQPSPLGSKCSTRSSRGADKRRPNNSYAAVPSVIGSNGGAEGRIAEGKRE